MKPHREGAAKVSATWRTTASVQKALPEAIYWQLKISNSFVTFRYQPTPAGVIATSQRWIAKAAQSGLRTRTVKESVSLCVPMKS